MSPFVRRGDIIIMKPIKKVAGLEWLIYIQGILFARKTANLNFVNITTITLP